MAHPENWITRVEIDGDTMTINGVPVVDPKDQKDIRDRWKEETDLWNDQKPAKKESESSQ